MSPKEPELREQDRWLPIANVGRLMKNTLPASAKVSKDAKECMQECVSEFISFITSEASDNCSGEKRKTINGEDILNAMTTLGFENYSEALKIYLTKYREQQAIKQERGDTGKRQVSIHDDLVNAPLDQENGFPDASLEQFQENNHFDANINLIQTLNGHNKDEGIEIKNGSNEAIQEDEPLQDESHVEGLQGVEHLVNIGGDEHNGGADSNGNFW